MSLEALTEVWKYSEQSGGNLLVMLALADYADDRGRAWPAVETLAKKARKDRRTIQRILRKLEADGEIAPAAKTKTGTVVWQLADFGGRQNAGAAKRRPRQNDHGGGGKNAASGAVKMPPNPSVKPLLNPHEEDGSSTATSKETNPAPTAHAWPSFMAPGSAATDSDRALVLAAGYTPAKVSTRVAWAVGRIDRSDNVRGPLELQLQARAAELGGPVPVDGPLGILDLAHRAMLLEVPA